MRGDVRDYIEMGRLQAEWEERTGRVDHGIYRTRDEDDSGDWHEELMINRYFGEDQ